MRLTKLLFTLAFAFVSSCAIKNHTLEEPESIKATTTTFELPVDAACRLIVTPLTVQNYFVCIGPFAYCWVGEQQGISCYPRQPEDNPI